MKLTPIDCNLFANSKSSIVVALILLPVDRANFNFSSSIFPLDKSEKL